MTSEEMAEQENLLRTKVINFVQEQIKDFSEEDQVTLADSLGLEDDLFPDE